MRPAGPARPGPARPGAPPGVLRASLRRTPVRGGSCAAAAAAAATAAKLPWPTLSQTATPPPASQTGRRRLVFRREGGGGGGLRRIRWGGAARRGAGRALDDSEVPRSLVHAGGPPVGPRGGADCRGRRAITVSTPLPVLLPTPHPPSPTAAGARTSRPPHRPPHRPARTPAAAPSHPRGPACERIPRPHERTSARSRTHTLAHHAQTDRRRGRFSFAGGNLRRDPGPDAPAGPAGPCRGAVRARWGRPLRGCGTCRAGAHGLSRGASPLRREFRGMPPRVRPAGGTAARCFAR